MAINNTNGGWKGFDDFVPARLYFRKTSDVATKSVKVKQGQVLKARSFVATDTDGKVIAHPGIAEAALVTFANIAAGLTVNMGGLTFTAGASGATAAQQATAWATAAVGDTAAAATTKIAAAGITAAMGTFTAGTLAGWETELYSATKVSFRSTALGTNATDLAATGTAAAPTIVTIQGATSFSKIAGVLAFDVDATSADVAASVYIEGSFWADALVWAVDPAVDTITLSDGTTRAVTAYNTGCFGTSEASNLLKQKFVEGSEFEELGFSKLGEL